MAAPERFKTKYVGVLSRGITQERGAFRLGCRGFSLVELITVMGVVAALATMSIPVYDSYLVSVRNGRCVADLRTIDKAVTAYILEKNSQPAQLSDIGAAANQLDPWGRAYVYQNFTIDASGALKDEFDEQLNTDYDLYSMGRNGASAQSYADPTSADDIARHNDGTFVGLRDPSRI
ncbi:type II secretion system protein [Geobacter sp. AOG2]|uniref:type II secretion system protein n=1 Tax=Geobacter sp. AOG2 TaxID=1566347 RepID=UPI001CC7F5A6|nr:prepilin-type N-terminal cleavage/methylation domain-containing protein [Geobacter sp. AOG2]